ncbi:MAG: hypothetical protein ACI976_000409 [Aureispira sp.]|jgi:hypothetical protein
MYDNTFDINSLISMGIKIGKSTHKQLYKHQKQLTYLLSSPKAFPLALILMKCTKKKIFMKEKKQIIFSELTIFY